MRKAVKKLIALLVCLVMVISLAACGGEKPKDTPDNSTPTKAPDTGGEDVAEATPTEVPDPYPAFDFGGRTIKVGTWFDYFYTSDHTDISDNPKVGNTETAQMQLDNVRRVEEKYKVKIQFVNYGWSGCISSINTSIAAGTPECDIYMVDLQFGIPAVQNGLAQDLREIVPAYNDLFGEQKIVKPLEGLGGTYFLGDMTEHGTPTRGIFLGYNKTMIDDLALEDPQTLYKEGKWTFEKFAELAKKGTQDLDKDGLTDIYGYGGIFTDFTHGLVLNNGGNLAAGETEGISSPATMEALELIDRLYNKDMSARPWNGSDWDDNQNAWSDGKVMFWTAQQWSLKAQIDAANEEGAELPFEFHVVPYPHGSYGDGTLKSPVSGNWYIVPVGVKEPDKVLQVFEEFLNWHKGDEYYRDDTSYYESSFLSQEDVDIAYSTGRNLVFDVWGCLGDYFAYGNMIWWPIVVNKESTVAQAVETAKPVLQAALDHFYKK